MICEACTNLVPLADCGDSILLGKAPLANTQYNIYFKDLATSGIQVVTGTSDASKDLTFVMDALTVIANHTYKIWISNAGGSEAEWQPIVLAGETHQCFYQMFEKKLQNGYLYGWATQTMYPA